MLRILRGISTSRFIMQPGRQDLIYRTPEQCVYLGWGGCLPKCYRFQCYGSGKMKTGEGECFWRADTEDYASLVSKTLGTVLKPGQPPRINFFCWSVAGRAFYLLICNQDPKPGPEIKT